MLRPVFLHYTAIVFSKYDDSAFIADLANRVESYRDICDAVDHPNSFASLIATGHGPLTPVKDFAARSGSEPLLIL